MCFRENRRGEFCVFVKIVAVNCVFVKIVPVNSMLKLGGENLYRYSTTFIVEFSQNFVLSDVHVMLFRICKFRENLLRDGFSLVFDVA